MYLFKHHSQISCFLIESIPHSIKFRSCRINVIWCVNPRSSNYPSALTRQTQKKMLNCGISCGEVYVTWLKYMLLKVLKSLNLNLEGASRQDYETVVWSAAILWLELSNLYCVTEMCKFHIDLCGVPIGNCYRRERIDLSDRKQRQKPASLQYDHYVGNNAS